MADPLRAQRDALEQTQTQVKQLRERLNDPRDAQRVEDQARDELARLGARAGQLTRELPELRRSTEEARLSALEAKRVAAESTVAKSFSAEVRLLALAVAVGGGIALGLSFGRGLWEGILTPWLPWVFGAPAGVMLVRELYELGQKLGVFYRDEQ